MHSSALLILLSTLPVAFAQGYGGGGNSPGTTSSSSSSSHPTTTSASVAAVHTVTVGANGVLAFSPNTITAAVGDVVEYIFFPPAHSVAQSTFAEPCTPFSNGTSFFSGGMTTNSGQNANTFQITINDTSTIWFFCAFPGHCEAGMAGVINLPAGSPNTLDAYMAAAKNISNPTTPTTVQGGVIGPAIAASSGTTTSSSSTPSPTAKNVGVEVRGNIRWTLLGFTGAAAVLVGSLMV